MSKKGTRTNFENVLLEIHEDPGNVFIRHPRMLSHLSGEKLTKLREELSGLDTRQKTAFYNAMCDAAEESFEYDFTPIAALGICDENGDVRAASFRAFLTEDTEAVSGRIMDAALNDPCEEAQIAAIRILGQYMYDEEMEDPIPVPSEELHQTLEKLLEDKKPAVRRRALIAYAPSESRRVHELISGFLAGNDKEEIIAALRAIRISLNEKWNKSILEMINHEDEDISIEAVMTAGMLQLREALPVLFEILSRFDRISPEMLTAAADAVAEIGDESAL
ncbi:MAG: HEAT repeat domain-containing protein, partial [Anaerolineaceae bacterium]|nr:HEAT repeat domain-containing protein [Anaerolineaceae bacterium]